MVFLIFHESFVSSCIIGLFNKSLTNPAYGFIVVDVIDFNWGFPRLLVLVFQLVNLVPFIVVSSFLSLSSSRSFHCRLVPFSVISSFLSLSSPRSFHCRRLVLFSVVLVPFTVDSSFLSLSSPRSFLCRLLVPFCLSIIFITLLYFYFPLSLKLSSYALLIISSSRS